MPLPIIKQPLFNITIPSTNKKVKYRPFTVKEEKILLIAQESKDAEQIITAMKQVINNCVQDIDVEKLATFDIEYLLLQLRAKSVNNLMTFKVNDPETDEAVELQIDINDIKIQKHEKHKIVIEADDGVFLKMKYPTIDQMRLVLEAKADEQSTVTFNMMMKCIDVITKDDDVYKTSDFTDDEVMAFIDSLSAKSINDIREFFETMPKMRYEKEYTNSKGNKHTFVAEGTETFFI